LKEAVSVGIGEKSIPSIRTSTWYSPVYFVNKKFRQNIDFVILNLSVDFSNASFFEHLLENHDEVFVKLEC